MVKRPSGAVEGQSTGLAPRPRFARLRRSADFRRIQGAGRKLRSPNLLVLATRGAGPVCRAGLTVSRKVGGAVVRNRVKRWLREALRAIGAPSGGPWDLVLVAHPSAAVAGLVVLQTELSGVIGRLGT